MRDKVNIKAVSTDHNFWRERESSAEAKANILRFEGTYFYIFLCTVLVTESVCLFVIICVRDNENARKWE